MEASFIQRQNSYFLIIGFPNVKFTGETTNWPPQYQRPCKEHRTLYYKIEKKPSFMLLQKKKNVMKRKQFLFSWNIGFGAIASDTTLTACIFGICWWILKSFQPTIRL